MYDPETNTIFREKLRKKWAVRERLTAHYGVPHWSIPLTIEDAFRKHHDDTESPLFSDGHSCIHYSEARCGVRSMFLDKTHLTMTGHRVAAGVVVRRFHNELRKVYNDMETVAPGLPDPMCCSLEEMVGYMAETSFYINFEWMKSGEHQLFNNGWAFETDSRRRGGLVAREHNATIIFQVRVGDKEKCRLGVLKSYENVGTVAVTIGGMTQRFNAIWERQYSVLSFIDLKRLPKGNQELRVVLVKGLYFKMLRLLCQ